MSIALLGVPVDFEFRGKLFKVAPRDLFIKISFADWCGIDAGLTLSRYRPHWPADFYDAQMRLLNSKIIGKQLRWGSEEVFNASWSEEGIRQLLYLKMMRGTEKGGARPERELLDDIAEDWSRNHGLLAEELEALPAPIRTRVLRAAAVAAGARDSELSREHVLAVDSLITDWRGQTQIDLPGSVKAVRRDGHLGFERAEPN